MKCYAFIYNPAARGGKSGYQIETLEQKIEQLPGAKLFRSKRKGDISDLVNNLLPDYDIFVACGGDGTVREVASQLVNTDKTMGIIPLGTGNDLCKTLDIPIDLKRSFQLVEQGKSVAIDVGQCNDFYFLNSLGFGFDGLTNRYALEMDRLPSFLRYMIAALKATFQQEKFELSLEYNKEEKSQELIMATVANGRVEGGAFWVAPQASVTDGKLNLVTIRPITRWLIPLLLPLILVKKPGWISHVQTSEIEKIFLSFTTVPEIHADGEVIKTNRSEFNIQLIPNGLEVLCGI